MKNLVLFSGAYPFLTGEQFLKDEIEILSSYFKNITIICVSENKIKINKKTKGNITSHYFRLSQNRLSKLSSLRYLFNKNVRNEIRYSLKYKNDINILTLVKIILLDFSKAKIISAQSKKIIEKLNYHSDETIFYSYWHDIRAVSICLLKEHYPTAKFIARAHRWDIYFDANTPHFLPFKGFLFEKLNHTVLISEDAINYINSFFPEMPKSLKLFKLGKSNKRKRAILNRNENSYIICSCSALIGVKRVDKIINSLALIKGLNIKWIHFGSGPLQNKLTSKAQNTLKHIDFEFKGNVENFKILDFYSENFVDLFINLSDSEGVPVSIMEAQSAGIPVIATNVGGTKEIVNDENGLLVDKADDINLLAKSISNQLKLPIEEKSLKRELSFDHWNKNYNADKNYLKFCNFLKDHLK